MNVSGAIIPDWTGDYLPDGEYANEHSWKAPGESRYLWYGGVGTGWVLSAAKGVTDNWWQKAPLDPWGDYDPMGTYTGTATVAAII